MAELIVAFRNFDDARLKVTSPFIRETHLLKFQMMWQVPKVPKIISWKKVTK